MRDVCCACEEHHLDEVANAQHYCDLQDISQQVSHRFRHQRDRETDDWLDNGRTKCHWVDALDQQRYFGHGELFINICNHVCTEEEREQSLSDHCLEQDYCCVADEVLQEDFVVFL